MLTITLIRHGKTYGNTLLRYIGSTDEPLCEEGIQLLKQHSYEKAKEVDALYSSPMLRCRQTAKLIYPNLTPTIMDELRECDFGDFENKNYKELQDNKDYDAWILSNGTLPFPNGESKDTFIKRTLFGFQKVLMDIRDHNYDNIALIVHGGTIMSILSTYSTTQKSYYDWSVNNGEGYVVELIEPTSKEQGIQLHVLNSITKG